MRVRRDVVGADNVVRVWWVGFALSCIIAAAIEVPGVFS